MAVKTIGIRTSLWNNNLKTIVLLTLLPATIVTMVWITMHVMVDELGDPTAASVGASVLVLTLIAIWFMIAYFLQEQLTMSMVGAIPVERKEHPELYNLTENLSIASGITMPKLYIMETEAMNAFATGLRINNAVICVTRGLLDNLNKQELEAVLAHEMSHILHRDMRVLTIATLFVGAIAFLAELMLRGGSRVTSSKSKNNGGGLALIFIVAIVGYAVAILSKFAISRKREYMADAGSVTLTKNKDAMIEALSKISGKSEIEDAPSDVRYMLFDNTKAYLGLFDTHPPIEKRIEALKQY